jgi:tRNA dimethylallyltransferase
MDQQGSRETFSSPVTLLVIAGPTATGKSELALSLAERVGGEIVSVDSAQVYRGLDVGTAKATREERERIPTHLLDVIDPEEQWSAKAFQEAADRVVSDLSARGRIPVVCGGTGLWLRALLYGLFEAPEISPAVREAVRSALRERGSAAMHEALKTVDPEAASRIQAGDPQRIGRALEVFEETGQPISELQKSHGFRQQRYRVCGFMTDMPRAEHNQRIEARTRRMYETGIVEEVEACLERGIRRDAPGLSIIGYRDVVGFLTGVFSKAEAVEKTIVATRQYAKRQRNWFRSMAVLRSLPPDGGVERILSELRNSGGTV